MQYNVWNVTLHISNLWYILNIFKLFPSRYGKWFCRWDATHLLHDASLDSSVNEAFLQHQCITTWEKCGGAHFTHYTTRVASKYKTVHIDAC